VRVFICCPCHKSYLELGRRLARVFKEAFSAFSNQNANQPNQRESFRCTSDKKGLSISTVLTVEAYSRLCKDSKYCESSEPVGLNLAIPSHV
jgi:hypothetical protein